MIDVANIQIGDVVSTKRQSIVVEKLEHICGDCAFYGKTCRKTGLPLRRGGVHRYIFASVIYRVMRGTSIIMRQ